MYRVKLIKGRSYTGAIHATQAHPTIDVEDKAIADAAVATGYFEFVETGDDDNALPDISEMTVPQLEKYAKDKNIDLGGLTKKADIIKLIKVIMSERVINNGSADFDEDNENE